MNAICTLLYISSTHCTFVQFAMFFSLHTPAEFFVPSPVLVVNFTGPPGTPANASGQYRCVVFGSTFEEVPEFFRLAERNITVSVQGEAYACSGLLCLNNSLLI